MILCVYAYVCVCVCVSLSLRVIALQTPALLWYSQTVGGSLQRVQELTEVHTTQLLLFLQASLPLSPAPPFHLSLLFSSANGLADSDTQEAFIALRPV